MTNLDRVIKALRQTANIAATDPSRSTTVSEPFVSMLIDLLLDTQAETEPFVTHADLRDALTCMAEGIAKTRSQ
jgi:hypothetical protein